MSSGSTPSSSTPRTPLTSTSSTPSTSVPVKLENVRADRSMPPKKMSVPTTVSEWQLLAVLSRANLVQYYDAFISQGGDDINQIMQCEEQEFLEIMSIVGMLSKPLHVRRLQRALNEFSRDSTAFHLQAIQQIGPPPGAYTLPVSSDPVTLLLPGTKSHTYDIYEVASCIYRCVEFSGVDVDRYREHVVTIPAHIDGHGAQFGIVGLVDLNGIALELSESLHESVVTDAAAAAANSANVATPAVIAPQPPPPIIQPATIPTSHRATANVVPGTQLGHHFGATSHRHQSAPQLCVRSTSAAAGQEKEGSASPFLANYNDFVSLGDFDPNNPSPTENPVLSQAQINRLAECALAASKNLPVLPPRLVQNKKRVSKEVLDLMRSSADAPNRLTNFRKFSAIYGRFDTKRKPHKVLTLHETTVNEAAAQLCLLVPALLTRRDELFPLARQVVKDAGYHYAKSRKRPCDPADLHSPISSPSTSPPPPPGLAEQGFEYENYRAEQSEEGSSGDSRIKQEVSDSQNPQQRPPSQQSQQYMEQWGSNEPSSKLS
ncbi:unnamed protein product [Caenorhabditis bovis]|uniref:NAB co-repressor domain-containing protein n=1 Tax=Caenorhabditis bovis TaxID=2654633 RepID=A0A8S1ETC2_9PELO|nr:unnamed protein product [Caenorhabditis bovis]